nr:uncharacterized protein LOC102413634 isoform X3 [Bubalus bubalis]
MASVMGEGRGWTPNTLQVHTHTHCGAACIHPPLPAVRPSQPRPATPLRCRARSVGGGSPHGGQRRAGVAPPLRLAFFPAPPTLGRNYGGPARGRRAHSCRIPPPHFPTPSPRAVGAAACAAPTRFGAAAREVGTPLFHSARTASGGKREKSCDPAPAKTFFKAGYFCKEGKKEETEISEDLQTAAEPLDHFLSCRSVRIVGTACCLHKA